MQFACGESLCKKVFDAPVPEQRSAPVRCPACNRSLYARDVLADTELDRLDQHRAVLMRIVAGARTEVSSADLVKAGAAPAPARSMLDEIAEATAHKARGERVPSAAENARRGVIFTWVAVTLIVIVATATLLWRLFG